jgi:assimilatory nitrate reductase catalytic subunit
VALCRDKLKEIDAEYWSAARVEGGWRIELGHVVEPESWSQWTRALGIGDSALAYHDRKTGQHRFAAFDGDRLTAALFVARSPVAVPRSWAAQLLEARFSDPAARLSLLAGRPGAAERDKGAIVCACFQVGQLEIADAAARGCTTVSAIGAALQAGTNCGSCRSEIGRILDANRITQAG